jgi:hypothetical protein
LNYLLDVGQRPRVTIQILPLEAGVRPGIFAPFSNFCFSPVPTVEAVSMENLRGTSVLEDSIDLALYANAFDTLRSSALSPDASADLIRRIIHRSKDTQR